MALPTSPSWAPAALDPAWSRNYNTFDMFLRCGFEQSPSQETFSSKKSQETFHY